MLGLQGLNHSSDKLLLKRTEVSGIQIQESSGGIEISQREETDIIQRIFSTHPKIKEVLEKDLFLFQIKNIYLAAKRLATSFQFTTLQNAVM